jgi:hypothetical protein
MNQLGRTVCRLCSDKYAYALVTEAGFVSVSRQEELCESRLIWLFLIISLRLTNLDHSYKVSE